MKLFDMLAIDTHTDETREIIILLTSLMFNVVKNFLLKF